MSGRITSATRLKICRDRRVGKIRTPDDELRDSLTGGSLPNSTPGSPQPNAPEGRHLVARRRRTTPPKNHLPAEGPSLRPSLALNIDPVPVYPLTHITLSSHRHPHDSTPTPAPDSAPDPYLHLIQSNQDSVLPPARVSSPLYLFQSSQPIVCIIHRPWGQLQVRQVQALHLLKPTEPSPVTRPVQELLICSSSRPRPRVCS